MDVIDPVKVLSEMLGNAIYDFFQDAHEWDQPLERYDELKSACAYLNLPFDQTVAKYALSHEMIERTYKYLTEQRLKVR